MGGEHESWGGRALPFDGWGATAFDGWEVSEDGCALTIWWREQTFKARWWEDPSTLRVFSAEEDDAVHVLAIDTALPSAGFPGEPEPIPDYDGSAMQTRLPEPARATVRLAAPVGRRPVIDAATGKPARRGTPPRVEPRWF